VETAPADTGARRERRRSRRLRTSAEHGVTRARLRPGLEVALVEISALGALVEAPRPLRPGAAAELHLEAGNQRAAVRGRIVRCEVASLISTHVSYRGAIGFDAELAWFSEEEPGSGYALPSLEEASRGAGREGATRRAL
jgi:hypothetical protein